MKWWAIVSLILVVGIIAIYAACYGALLQGMGK